RLYGDVDGPLSGPRQRQLRRFLATVRRYHLSGSVVFTTTEPGDRAFLAVLAGTFGFTYAEAAAHTTLSADWTTCTRPGSAVWRAPSLDGGVAAGEREKIFDN